MRIIAPFFVVIILFAIPGITSAATNVPKCFLTSSLNPTATKTFNLASAQEVQAYEKFVLGSMLCPSACYDIRARLVFTGISVTVEVVGTNACAPKDASKETAAMVNRGCGAGKKAPALSLTLTGSAHKSPNIKTRCDVTEILKSTGGDSSDVPDTGFALKAQLLEKVGSIDTNSAAGKEQLSLVLQNYGVSKESADEQVNSSDKATSVQQKLQDFISGDEVSAKAAADTLGLKLNGDLSDQSRLEPDKFKPVLSESEYQQAKVHQSAFTGFGPGAPAVGADSRQFQPRCGINDSFVDGLAAIESSCGRNVYSATTNVIGPFQFLCSTWRNYTLRTGNAQFADCRNAADSGISTRVMGDVANQIYRPKFGQIISALGIQENSGLYMPHLLGEGGASKFFSLYAQNPNMSADALRGVLGNAAVDNNRSLFYAGGMPRTLSGVLAEVNSRMTGAPYTGGLATAGSPFGGFKGYYGGSPVGYGYTSPFGVGYGNPYVYNTVAPVGTPSGGVTQSAQTQRQVSAQSGSTAGQLLTQMAQGTNGSGVVTAPSQPVTPVATLIVQPSTVLVNNPLTISWSSVGLKGGDTCSLLLQTSASSTPAMIAEGSEGTKRITPTTAGTLLVSISCTNQGSAVLKKTVTVAVQ